MTKLSNAFRRVHFVGIKGVGMSALAQLFHHGGAIVSGSDVSDEFPTDKNLSNIGIVPLSFSEENIGRDIDCVIYSKAYKENHPEIQKTRELVIPLLDYGEALAYLFNQKKGIVVSGTHGKTTTTAMLAKIFEDAGLRPSALVGGEVLDWQNNMLSGEGEFFIAEGDEYQEKFLALSPRAILITNIEYDHPDFFPDFHSYKNAFRKLFKKLHSEGIGAIFEKDEHSLDISDDLGRRRIVFGPVKQPDVFNKLKLKVPGHHNRLNALGAFMLAKEFGIDEDVIFRSLAEFRGVKRRLEHYNDPRKKILIIDDYAHHPTEIRASISALKETYPERKIILVFQPHTFSRTEALFGDLEMAFDGIHTLIVADIYSSAREKEGNIASTDLVEKLGKRNFRTFYAPTFYGICAFLRDIASQNTAEKYIYLTMGAGDIWKVASELKSDF